VFAIEEVDKVEINYRVDNESTKSATYNYMNSPSKPNNILSYLNYKINS